MLRSSMFRSPCLTSRITSPTSSRVSCGRYAGRLMWGVNPQGSAVQPCAPWPQQVAVAQQFHPPAYGGKTRSPFGVWVLSLITLGIPLGVVVQDQQRAARLPQQHPVTPGLATLALSCRSLGG
jgi:hypothetical protein